MKIGILALQGAVTEHRVMLARLGVNTAEVRLPQDLSSIDALVIPGGESTTISKLLSSFSLIEPIKELIKEGLPILGTCAGLIILANDVVDDNKVGTLNVMEVAVRRNAYGRQLESFETDLYIIPLGEKLFKGVFIRAPKIESVGMGTEVLCQLNGKVVAIRQGKMIACTFHPELTEDDRFHRYFLELI